MSADEHDVEDIVAVEVRLADGQRRYFLTWGRIQDPVDARPLAEVVLRNSTAFALDGDPVSARILKNLRPATAATHFWECFFHMCQHPIPFGAGYDRWRERVAAEQEQGKALWYLGHADVEQSDEPDATLT